MENVEISTIIICYYILGVIFWIFVEKIIEDSNVTVKNLILYISVVWIFWPLVLALNLCFFTIGVIAEIIEIIKNKWDQIKDKEIL